MTASKRKQNHVPESDVRHTGKKQRQNGTSIKGTTTKSMMTTTPVVTHSKFPFEHVNTNDSVKRGEFALQWLLKPLEQNQFFTEIFEKDPKLVHTGDADKFKSLVSLQGIKKLLTLPTSSASSTTSTSGKKKNKAMNNNKRQSRNEKNRLEYGVDLDVARYNLKSGRSTHNKNDGEIAGIEAWKNFETGASLRLRRPQIQFDGIYRLCSLIEEFLECVVGANVYLTPVNHQGFAPHFDDIDAFICQVAGKKRWKVYGPRGDGLDDLPRGSSVDFSKEDMSNVKVIIDTVLQPGDMLYLPRGTIHEAMCVSDKTNGKNQNDYSLHVTVSMFQKWSWADLLETSIVTAVRSAAASDRTLRKTLPLRFGQFAGAQATESNKKLRDWFHQKVGTMLKHVAKTYPSDTAADMLMQEFMTQRLPPPSASKLPTQKSHEKNITLTTRVRPISKGAARIVIDNDGGETDGLPRIISCVRNKRSRAPLEVEEETSFSCLPEEAKAVDTILKAYPQSVVVANVPLESKKDRLDLVLALIDLGIVEPM